MAFALNTFSSRFLFQVELSLSMSMATRGGETAMPLTIFLLVKPSDLNDLVGPLGRVRIL